MMIEHQGHAKRKWPAAAIVVVRQQNTRIKYNWKSNTVSMQPEIVDSGNEDYEQEQEEERKEDS